MLARCLSASLLGFDAIPVTVEVDLAPGLPGLQLVGLPDAAIQESRERVRAALRNSGFRGPLVRVVVNLAPADLRKEGPCFDLPIALALLVRADNWMPLSCEDSGALANSDWTGASDPAVAFSRLLAGPLSRRPGRWWWPVTMPRKPAWWTA